MKPQRAFIVGHILQRFLLTLLMLLSTLSTVALAATVRGRLDRVNPNGVRYPAPGVAVTLFNRNSGRSTAAYAGADGLYYLYNVPAGSYYLEVWISRNPSAPPKVFPVSVADPSTDIPPIVVQ